MLGNMRWAHEQAEQQMAQLLDAHASAGTPIDPATLDVIKTAKDMAHSYAKDAAPYIHPRLANIEANVKATVSQEDALAALAAMKDGQVIDGEVVQ
jgi:hypothetical protein